MSSQESLSDFSSFDWSNDNPHGDGSYDGDLLNNVLVNFDEGLKHNAHIPNSVQQHTLDATNLSASSGFTSVAPSSTVGIASGTGLPPSIRVEDPQYSPINEDTAFNQIGVWAGWDVSGSTHFSFAEAL